jgi:hypothetical protein
MGYRTQKYTVEKTNDDGQEIAEAGEMVTARYCSKCGKLKLNW